jgi:hypothetical protein
LVFWGNKNRKINPNPRISSWLKQDMTKFILMLAAVFGLSVIAQAADPTPAPSPAAAAASPAKTKHHAKKSAKKSSKKAKKSAEPAASPTPKAS